MENYARDLEKRVMEVGPFENNFSKRAKKWEVLVVGDDGKVITMPWLKKVFIISIVICAALIIFLSIALALYGWTIKKNKSLTSDLNQYKLQNSLLKQDVDRLKLILAGVDADLLPEEKVAPKEEVPVAKDDNRKIAEDNSQKKSIAEPPKKDPVEKQKEHHTSEKKEAVPADNAKGKPEVAVAVQEPLEEEGTIDLVENLDENTMEDEEEVPIEPGETASDSQESRKISIAIDEFTASRKVTNDSIRIRFNIKNTSADEGAVSGNIFAILKSDIDDPNDWIVVPTVKLEGGKPTQFRRGQFFSIRKFKPVRFIITNRPDYDKFKKVTVFIFSRSGELVTEETFPLNL